MNNSFEEKTLNVDQYIWQQQRQEIDAYLENEYISKQKDFAISYFFQQIKSYAYSCSSCREFYKYCHRRLKNLQTSRNFGCVDDNENYENMTNNIDHLRTKNLPLLKNFVHEIVDIIKKNKYKNTISQCKNIEKY